MRKLKTVVPMPWHDFTPVSGAWMLHPRDVHLLDPVLGIDAFVLRDMPFAPHPHAGFSAVTVLYEESEVGFANYDSLGDQSVIHPGGLHWTQAGRGMMHDEPPLQLGPHVRGLQVFVNLATMHKEAPPAAFRVEPEAIPIIESDGARVRVVTGRYQGQASSLASQQNWYTPVMMLDITLAPGSRWQAAVASGERAFFVLMQGQVSVDNKVVDVNAVNAKAALVLADEGDAICIDNTGQGAVRGTLFIGKPLGQSIVARGPFNGNTQEDINRYIRRYRAGGMGILEPGGKLLAKPDLTVG